MTPKEKASELFYKLLDEGLCDRQAKDCAIIMVEEIINDYSSYRIKFWTTLQTALEMREYWDDVLTELNAL